MYFSRKHTLSCLLPTPHAHFFPLPSFLLPPFFSPLSSPSFLLPPVLTLLLLLSFSTSSLPFPLREATLLNPERRLSLLLCQRDSITTKRILCNCRIYVSHTQQLQSLYMYHGSFLQYRYTVGHHSVYTLTNLVYHENQ